MAKKWSTGFVNFVAANGSVKQAVTNARCLVFSGAQAADADSLATGTLLATLTKGGGAFTGETPAEWKATLSGVAGTLNGMVLGALVRAGTAQAGAATTITLDATASATDNIYNNSFIFITGGVGPGQYRKITGYVGATKVATVAAWTINPDVTSTFNIVTGVDLMSAAVAYITDLPTTAALAATNIQAFISFPDLEAYSTGADLFAKAPKGTGSNPNGLRLYAAASGGLTVTVATSGIPTTLGVDAVNGVNWNAPAIGGEITKETTAMQGNGAVAGTAGWFRTCFDSADDGLSASTTYKRYDGVIGVGSGEMQLSALQVVVGVPIIINTFPIDVLKTSV